MSAPTPASKPTKESTSPESPPSGVTIIKMVVNLLEKHPATWFLIGLLLLLLTEGSFRIILGGADLGLWRPTDKLTLHLLLFFGSGLMLFVASRYVLGHFKNKMTGILLTCAWFVLTAGIIHGYFRSIEAVDETVGWGYDHQKSEFSIILTNEGLNRHKGKFLVLICRKGRDDVRFEDDTAISKSAPIEITNFKADPTFSVDCTPFRRELVVGKDKVECRIYLVSRKDHIHSIKCASELRGEEYAHVYNKVVLELTPEAVGAELVGWPAAKREEWLAKINALANQK